MKLSVPMIQETVAQVLVNPSYRRAAEETQKKLRVLRGVERAAEIIDDALAQQRSKPGVDRSQFETNEALFQALVASGRG